MNAHRLAIFTALLGWLALATGCAGTGATAFRVPNVTDPPHLAPERRAFRPVTPADPGIALGAPSSSLPGDVPVLPELVAPDLEPPPLKETFPAPIPDLQGPQFPSGPIVPAARLELEVAAPPKSQVGSGATYRLTVRNPGDEPVYDVLLSAEFDDAIFFPGREEKGAEQTLGALAAGERKEVALSLSASQPGRHCARFSVKAGGREAIWKSVCVEFVPRRLELEMHGPDERTLGSRAEFTIVVLNVADEPLPDVTVTVKAPTTFRQREASAFVIREQDALVWRLGGLKPRERVEIQAEYECLQAAEDACVTAHVTGADVPEERRESCLRVSSVRGILDLRVEDTADPLAIGDETEFVATVHNRGLQAARDLRLEFVLPAHFELVSTEVREGDRPLAMRHRQAGQAIEFDTLPNLAAEQTVVYRAKVRSRAAGAGEFRASLRHGAAEDAVEAAEPVLVRPK
ncbi:MAG: hypothetical protein WED34_10825 [Planctomycetales bacterium]